MKKRILALILAVMMLVGIVPVTAFAADAAENNSVSITFAASDASEGFIFKPQKITVADGLAEKYGLTNDASVNGPTFLDVLIAAHIQKYGDAFTKEKISDYLSVGSSGMISKAFEKAATSTSFFYNGDMPKDSNGTGYMANAAVVKEGDIVEFWFYQDSYWMDYYTFFTQREKTVSVNQEFELTLKGFMAMNTMAGTTTAAPASAPVNATSGKDVLTVNTVNADGSLSAAIGELTPDSNGKIKMKFDVPGEYIVTVSGFCDDATMGEDSLPVVLPWCKVSVVGSDWKNFRNSDVNMGITNAPTPIVKDKVNLKWKAKLGTGWAASPSIQIIVDDALVTIVGTTIYKLDLQTGEVLAKGTLVDSTSYGYTPMTYADGMIFCPLSGGKIQAVDAKTLKSLWVYTDPLGGQALSPIAYSDGCIYTGFWNSETKDANFVCIDVYEDDPSEMTEAKSAVWTHKQPGGFYWAGSLVVGDAVIVGTDDGASGSNGDSHLYSFNKKTGAVISDLVLTGAGDQRSTISYDETGEKIYFTTKGGFLCSAKLDKNTGVVSKLKTHDNKAQSTSTPVVYKGKVYYGAGSGISSTGSSGNIVVADADTLEILYAVGLKGYPQCSVLLSTAYEESTGYIYIYSTYNNKPGGISMIKTKADNDKAEGAELIEIFDAKGFENYCITSLICGTDGTIYYKNDSGNIFAVGTNNAYTTGIGVSIASGAIELDSPFSVTTYEYEAVVPVGTESFDILINKTEGTDIDLSIEENETIENPEDNVNFSILSDETDKITYRVSMPETGKATPFIKLTNGSDTRTYKVHVRYEKTDSTLSVLKVNNSNAFPTGTSGVIVFDKEFSPDITDYTADISGIGKNFYNVWPVAADKNASVKVYAVENVNPDRVNEDGTINITSTNNGKNRYAVYPDDKNKSTVVKIEVTAEDGKTKTNYTVTFINQAVTVKKDETDGKVYAYQYGEKYAGEKGWILNDEGYYYVQDDAEVVTGWLEINGTWYYLDADNNGKMVTGWARIDGNWYYMNGSGAMLTGWQQIGGKWYYLSDSGAMLTGWQSVGGKWYYLSGSGAMLTGWQQVGGKWYYLNGSGAMVTGWAQIGGKWYYLNGSGAMLTGWQSIGGKWYYLSGSGAMVTGWAYVNGNWYYMNGNGAMVTGWQQIGGKWYYFNSSGAMLTGTQKINGKTYRFDSKGVWVS